MIGCDEYYLRMADLEERFFQLAKDCGPTLEELPAFEEMLTRETERWIENVRKYFKNKRS